jgi:Cu/Ag efflux pump CusA
LADVKERLHKIAFPLEYHYELVGDYAQRQALVHRLLIIGVAVAIGIFLLLQATFSSWRMALLTFVLLPVALVGGAVAVLVGGGRIELGALTGFVTVFTITVRNSIVLMKRYQQLERHAGEEPGREVAIRGARERLTPTLLTTTAAAAFFLPFALLGARPGHEVVNPMGWVVLGGLVTSAIVTLFVLPSLYLRFGYGRGQTEDLDLRELWVTEDPARSLPLGVAADGEIVGNPAGGGPGVMEARQE